MRNEEQLGPNYIYMCTHTTHASTIWAHTPHTYTHLAHIYMHEYAHVHTRTQIYYLYIQVYIYIAQNDITYSITVNFFSCCRNINSL